ncbi:MAG: hypothetical protein H0W27_01295 [Actinobacteria bacterium]|nr:hypothetical protein [Actinomycetota bacterium]
MGAEYLPAQVDRVLVAPELQEHLRFLAGDVPLEAGGAELFGDVSTPAGDRNPLGVLRELGQREAQIHVGSPDRLHVFCRLGQVQSDPYLIDPSRVAAQDAERSQAH